MLQSVLVYGAGVVLALVAILAARAWSGGRGPHWVLAGSLVVAALAASFATDRHLRSAADVRGTERVQALVDADPVFAAIRVADPASYSEIQRIVRDSADVPDAEREAHVRAMADPVVRRVVAARADQADDARVVETMRLVQEVMRARMKRMPTDCGFSYGVDVEAASALIGRERVARYVSDLFASPTAPRHAPVTIPQRRAMAASLTPAIAARENVAPEAVAQLSKTPSGRCRVVGDTFDLILSMPVPQAASAIRILSLGQFR